MCVDQRVIAPKPSQFALIIRAIIRAISDHQGKSGQISSSGSGSSGAKDEACAGANVQRLVGFAPVTLSNVRAVFMLLTLAK